MQASLDPVVEHPVAAPSAAAAPEVLQDVHASPLELGRLRILILVDHVLVQALVDQGARLGLHPRGHERRQVQPRLAVEHQLVVHQLIGRIRRQLAVGKAQPGHGRDLSRLGKLRPDRHPVLGIG